ncbi:MAG: hypothetical protein WC179_05080 [Candidatus Cloacimonadaceae bacterium]
MKQIITDTPLMDIHPKEWKDILDPKDTITYQYRNLLHFKSHVKTLTQKQDNNCDISYIKALKELLTDTPTIKEDEYQLIKNRVKQALLKRGLISENIYESYHYDVEGELCDVAKVIAEDPACFLVPTEKYTAYFYELYISISYPYSVPNSTIMDNLSKLLATIELLEREHIYCKVTLVFPDSNCAPGDKKNFLAMIPLFSHRDVKSISTMSAVLNDRLLRKFFFAILEDTFDHKLYESYGNAIKFPNVINIGDVLNEVELCQSILDRVIVKGTR